MSNEFVKCSLEEIIRSPNDFTLFKRLSFLDTPATKMSTSDDQNWLMTPYPEIFEKIMMMIGLDSLESLHRCRQVCTAWNAMIMQNIWESPSKRNIIKMRVTMDTINQM